MYLAAQQQNKLIHFLVCANVGVHFSLEILPQASESTYKPDFLFSNFGFVYCTARNFMSCFGA